MAAGIALFVRVRHLKNSAGSIYLNDLDVKTNRVPALKIPVYVPFGQTIDIPLNDAVLISYKRGSLFRHAQNNLIEVFLFSEKHVVEVSGTAAYTINVQDEIVLVDTSQGNVTVTLPPLSLLPQGQSYLIKKSSPDLNSLIVQTSNGDPIDGVVSAIATAKSFGAFQIQSTDVGWWIISEYPTPDTGTGPGTGVGQLPYQTDIFDIGAGGETQLTLTSVPFTGSENVYVNGVRINRGTAQDYTVVGNTIVFNDENFLSENDVVTVHYQFGDTGLAGLVALVRGARDSSTHERVYIGRSLDEGDPANAEWQIFWFIDNEPRIRFFAEGNDDFTHVWNDRESLLYS
jgi:hypothetical protein